MDEERTFQDLFCRFILNLSEKELNERIFFHIELAHWYYTDFRKHHSPSYKKLNEFGKKLILDGERGRTFKLFDSVEEFESALKKFTDYKSKIRVCGAAILNENLTKVLLVTPPNSSNCGFPRGKINENETGMECAIREVWEEIGCQIAGIITEENSISKNDEKGKSIKIYIIPRVKESTEFKTQTRGEVEKTEWYDINQISKKYKDNKFKRIAPFIEDIQNWIKQERENSNYVRPLWKYMNDITEKSLETYRHTPEKENPFLTFELDKESLKNCFT